MPGIRTDKEEGEVLERGASRCRTEKEEELKPADAWGLVLGLCADRCYIQLS